MAETKDIETVQQITRWLGTSLAIVIVFILDILYGDQIVGLFCTVVGEDLIVNLVIEGFDQIFQLITTLHEVWSEFLHIPYIDLGCGVFILCQRGSFKGNLCGTFALSQSCFRTLVYSVSSVTVHPLAHHLLSNALLWVVGYVLTECAPLNSQPCIPRFLIGTIVFLDALSRFQSSDTAQ